MILLWAKTETKQKLLQWPLWPTLSWLVITVLLKAPLLPLRTVFCIGEEPVHAACGMDNRSAFCTSQAPSAICQHLRTLMAALINFFLETQHTGEVNNPPPRVTSSCHFLPGVIFHHFHIRIFPMSLSEIKGKNWQVIIFPFYLFFSFPRLDFSV